MAEERIKRIADGIYKEVGGQENVDKVIHCMTRVRMDIRENRLRLTPVKSAEQ